MSTEPPERDDLLLRRRDAIVMLGGLGLGAVLYASGAGARLASSITSQASAAPSCVLTPEQTEGPYYVDLDLARRDITEDRTGVPLALRLSVVDASTCRAIRGATVDVWHCDAAGAYSAVGSGSASRRRFLRGNQRTDSRGLARFATIYPGWYPGRTPHIHVKVHAGGDVVHTGQLYFDEAVTDAVYRRRPYASRGSRDQGNATDMVYRNGGRQSLLRLSRDAASGGYTGALTMGVSLT